MSNGDRPLENKNVSLTKNQRQRVVNIANSHEADICPEISRKGRPKKPLSRKRDVRISFRVSFREYKMLLEQAGGRRRLSVFIRRKLGVEG